MQPVNALSQQFLYPVDVITQSVISRIGNDRMHRRRINSFSDQRIFGNCLTNGIRCQTIRSDRTDDAVAVTGRDQIGRNRSRQGNRVFDRFVAVAVAERNLIAGNAGHQNHLLEVDEPLVTW